MANVLRPLVMETIVVNLVDDEGSRGKNKNRSKTVKNRQKPSKTVQKPSKTVKNRRKPSKNRLTWWTTKKSKKTKQVQRKEKSKRSPAGEEPADPSDGFEGEEVGFLLLLKLWCLLLDFDPSEGTKKLFGFFRQSF